jgi:hypothetical protein
VRMIAKESQKPPYEDSAVAPKVLPTAISLAQVSLPVPCRWWASNVPHASKQLDKTSVPISERDDEVGVCNVVGADIDQRKHESSQGESRETQRRGIGELAARWSDAALDEHCHKYNCDLRIETGLEFTAKGRETMFFVGTPMS